MLDVLERARLEVVDADDAVVARQQVIAQVRAEKAATTGYETGWHLRSDSNSGFHFDRPDRPRRPAVHALFLGSRARDFANCEKNRSFLPNSETRSGQRDRCAGWEAPSRASSLETSGTLFPARCGHSGQWPGLPRAAQDLAASCVERGRSRNELFPSGDRAGLDRVERLQVDGAPLLALPGGRRGRLSARPRDPDDQGADARSASELAPWLHTVIKHEALAIRRQRERMLGGEHSPNESAIEEEGESPEEQAPERERVRRTAEALSQLKPSEVQCLLLKAVGYSYDEAMEYFEPGLWSGTRRTTGKDDSALGISLGAALSITSGRTCGSM